MATAYTAPGTSVTADADAAEDDGVEHLIDAYRQPAFNLAYRLVRRPEDAADAVQDAFVLAMRATRGSTAAPREPGRFRSWLLKIVANVALAQLRRRKSASSVSLDALATDLSDGQPDQPLTTVVQREQRGDVLQALLALPDAQRAALTLREYQGLSYDEIGELLGMERGAITALLYRARAGFRAAYEGVAAHPKSVGCSKLAPLISAMLDEELEAETWQRVDRHLAGCPRCRRELKQLRRGRRLHAVVPILTPPAGWSGASTLGAAGASGAAGLAGVAGKAPVLGGLVERAAELSRPLVTGSLLGAAAVLPGGTAGGLGPVAERGFAKLAGLATAAGLFVAVAAGSPAHHPNAEPSSASARAAGDAASAARDAAAGRAALQPGALRASRDVQPLGPASTWLAPVPAAFPSTSVAGESTTAGGRVSPVALTEAAGSGAGPEIGRPVVEAAVEVPVAVAQRESASLATETAAYATGEPGDPAPASPSFGASLPASPPSTGLHSGRPSTDPPPAGGPGTGESGAPPSGGGSSAPAGQSPSDPSSPDSPVADFPPLDLPPLDVPIPGLPAIDLPPIAVGSVVTGEIDVPPVDLAPVDLGAVARSVVGQPSLDLPALDVAALDVPAVDVRPLDLPLVEGSLDRVRSVTGLPERALASASLGEVAEQVGRSIPLEVVGPDVARGPAGGPGVTVGAASAAGPGLSVSSGSQGAPGATLSAATGSSPAEAALSVDASVGMPSEPGDAANGQAVGTVDLNATVAAGSGTLSSADGTGAGLNVSATVEAGANGAGNADGGPASTSLSVNASVDAGSSGSNGSADSGATSASLSVNASVDTGSNSSNSSDSSSGSTGLSVSVDTGSNSSSSSDSNSSGSSISVSAGGISVSVP